MLRAQSDERLVEMTRAGNQSAYEALMRRYESRLFAFCRHMLGSKEDAEDILQEVFTAAYNAMIADDRPLQVRPWFYRIARNRSLNHLRKPVNVGQDTMDDRVAAHGTTTADHASQREEFLHIVTDVSELPETQRSALLLREIDDLTYEEIAASMDTTVPSVKSLLVRARISLAQASRSRELSCDEVRVELAKTAEGLQRLGGPARRHVRHCDQCHSFKSTLTRTNRALAAVYPIGPLLFIKKFVVAKLLLGGSSAASGSAAGGAAAGGAVAGGAAAGGASAGGGLISAGIGAVATKAAAGAAAAAIVAGTAVSVQHQPAVHTPAPNRAAAGSNHAATPTPAASAATQPTATAQPTTTEPAPTPAAAATADPATPNTQTQPAPTTGSDTPTADPNAPTSGGDTGSEPAPVSEGHGEASLPSTPADGEQPSTPSAPQDQPPTPGEGTGGQVPPPPVAGGANVKSSKTHKGGSKNFRRSSLRSVGR